MRYATDSDRHQGHRARLDRRWISARSVRMVASLTALPYRYTILSMLASRIAHLKLPDGQVSGGLRVGAGAAAELLGVAAETLRRMRHGAWMSGLGLPWPGVFEDGEHARYPVA